MKTFSISESLKYGWDKFKENMEISLLSTLIILVSGMLVGFHGGRFERGFLPIFVLNIALTVLVIIIRIGYTKIYLRINDGDKPKLSDIFSEYKLFWKYLGVSILVPIIVILGLILLIVPGIIWALTYCMAMFIVVDTGVGPMVAIRESKAITKGNKLDLLFFWITIAFINFIGFLVFGIGLIVTVPVSTFASVYVYRALSKAKANITLV